jgi:hypothetical protein
MPVSPFLGEFDARSRKESVSLMYFAYWFSTLYVVIEGYKEIGIPASAQQTVEAGWSWPDPPSAVF